MKSRGIARFASMSSALILLGAVALLDCSMAAEPLKECTSTAAEDACDDWRTYIAVGSQLTPDYKEDGNSNGLKKAQLFAQIVADGKFGCDSNSNGDCPYLFTGYAPFHAGVTLTLLGTAVSRAAEENPTLTPTRFDDVARTVVTSGYLFAPIHETGGSSNVIGPMLRASAISRDTLRESGDSVNWAYSLGLQYANEDFRGRTRNGVPGGYVRVSYGRFEDYAGLGRRSRLLVDAAMELNMRPPLGIYVGVMGNFGKGPDELGVVFTFVRKTSELMEVLKLGKESEEADAPQPTP